MTEREVIAHELQTLQRKIKAGEDFPRASADVVLEEAIKSLKPARPAILATDHDTPDGITYCVCPSCRIMIDYQDRYCRYCGQALSWETK